MVIFVTKRGRELAYLCENFCMQNVIFSDWNIVRVVRLVLALIIVVNAIQYKDWVFLILGGYFLYLAVFNVKCGSCANGNCEVPVKKEES